MSEVLTREEYTRQRKVIEAMGKERAIPPKAVDPQSRGYHTYISCRRCGRVISEAGDNYCSGCGQKVMHASYAGTQGWKEKSASEAWAEMLQEWEATHKDDTTGG